MECFFRPASLFLRWSLSNFPVLSSRNSNQETCGVVDGIRPSIFPPFHISLTVCLVIMSKFEIISHSCVFTIRDDTVSILYRSNNARIDIISGSSSSLRRRKCNAAWKHIGFIWIRYRVHRVLVICNDITCTYQLRKIDLWERRYT